MNQLNRNTPQRLTMLLLLLLGALNLNAQLWWDPVPGTAGPGDGNGNWSNLGSHANWWNGAANVPWNPNDIAVIGFNTATAGTITLTNKIQVGGIIFSNFGTAAYTIAASSITSIPLANATNLLFTGSAPQIVMAAHNVTNAQIVEAISASVITTSPLSVSANSTMTNGFVRFANFTNNFSGGALIVGTPGNNTYGDTTAIFCDINTPTAGDPYVACANNLTNVTVHSNATFRISNHNTGTRSTLPWPRQITISGDGRNGNSGAWVVTGNVGDNYIANVILAGDSTIDFNAGTANRTFGIYGVVSGNGRLQLVCGNASKQTAEFTNANTYVGETVIGGGLTARLISGDDRLPTGTVLTLGTTTTPVVEWNKLGKLILGNSTLPVNQTLAGLQTAGVAGCVVEGGHSTLNSTLTVNAASDYAYVGALGGAAAPASRLALAKTGVGKLSLQGTNLCAGGYTVTAGTLEFGDGVTDYPLSGLITNNSTVAFNVASSVSYDQNITGAGNLTKAGPGTLTLTGTNNYSGSLTVSGGVLSTTTAKTGTGAIVVGNGLELDIKRHAANAKITAASATFDSDTVKFDFNLKGPNATPMLDVTGALNNTGMMNIYIQNAGTLTVGTYPLIKYGSFVDGGASAFNLAAPISPRVTASIVNNTTTKAIELVVSAVDFLKWTGATDSIWDTTTTNWLLTGSASAINYADGELVQLDDTGANTAINLGIGAAPGMITVNNTGTPYSISGSGSLGGSGTLVKNGSGSLTLAVSGGANQSGGTVVQAGTLTLGDGTTDCSVSAPLENNGVLNVNVIAANNLPAISGTGSLSKQGAGELTLDEASTYGGNTSVTAGSVRVANSAAFGSAAGGTTVSSGAELLVDASGLNIPEPLTIGGSGLGPAGALTVGDTMNSIWSGKVTASADTVFAAGFSSIFTFADSLLAGGNAVTFASKTSSYFVLASNVTASAVSLGALPGDVATGGLHLNGPNETLTNIQVLLNIQASSTPPANSGLFAKHSLALGTNSTVVLTNGQSIGNTGARLSLENNVSIPSGVGLLAYCPGQGLDGPGGYRCTLSVRSNSTNIWNGPITIHGADPALSSGGLFTLYAGENAVGGRMVVNGNLTIADGVANVLIRGFSGSGSIQGIVNLGTNNLQMADASPWTISSTGNTWAEAQLGGSGASLNLGQHNALCLTAPVRLANGAPANALDLQGYNQQLAGLYSISGTGSTVRNSSTNTDSTLKVLSNVGSNWVYSGTIANVGGAKALHLDVAGDTLTLENAGNNYAGNTTIRSGATLALSGNGNITASPLVDIQGGGTLDVTALTAGSWTMGAALTLKGNGTVVGVLNVSGTVAPGGSIGQLNVTGDVTMNNGGTSLMEVNNAAGTNDVLDVSGTLTYGGTLVVTNISGTPYSNGQVIKLFNAGSYVGSFANIVIAGGGSYDASNLAVNGTITVYSVSTTPTSLTFFTTGGGTAMDLSWPADHTGWRLQAQTNSLSTGLTTTWHTVPGSTTTNHMIIPVAPGNPTVFFRLIYP